MRKYFAAIVGAGLLAGGLWLIYSMIFVSGRLVGLAFGAAGLLMFLGAYVIWHTIKDWNSNSSPND